MKIESKFRIALVVILLAMLFVGYLPYMTSVKVNDTIDALRLNAKHNDEYVRLLKLLQDAETSQRGFIITGKENFLHPYKDAARELPQLLASIGSNTSGPIPESVESDIRTLVKLKMDELAETIQLRRKWGFDKPAEMVMNESGKIYMDRLRNLIADALSRFAAEQQVRRHELAARSDLSLYLSFGTTFANLGLLMFMMALVFKEMKARQATTKALEEAGSVLIKNVSEMELCAQMLQALGAMSTVSDTTAIIATYCGKLLPDLSGTLFLYRNSRDLLESQTSWGKEHTSPASLEPTDCWALHRGTAHYTKDSHDLCCKHYSGNLPDGSGRLCIPLVTQGEVIGMIYLEGLPSNEARSKSNMLLINRVAEQIALALSNVKLRETLRLQTIIDPLTGLFNRRYMDETLKREVIRAERKKAPLSLIVLDLDHFKRVNDTFGHDCGDALLKAVAQRIKDNIRESDLACRFGGEEMVIILPECDLEVAVQRAEVIRHAIATLDVHHNGQVLGTVTASFGVAHFPRNGREPGVLVRAADQALYQAKHNGRNCVVAAATLEAELA